LRLAERSPVGRAEKDKHRSFRAADGFQGLSPTFLVLGRKIRHPVSNRRAGLDVLAVKNGKREQSTKYKIASVSLSPRFANSLASERPPD